MSNIARIRSIRDLSQAELGEMVGVKQPHISRIERGDEGPPLALFRSIADALGVTLCDLFADERTSAETLLLDVFRKLPPDRQKGWLDMANLALSETPPKEQ